MNKLDHTKLSKKYKNAYDAIKDIYDNSHKEDGEQLWMNSDGELEVIGEDNTFIAEYDERDLFHILDFFGVYCYIQPNSAPDNKHTFSAMILKPDNKTINAGETILDRKAVENLLLENGVRILDEFLVAGIIKYSIPNN